MNFEQVYFPGLEIMNISKYFLGRRICGDVEEENANTRRWRTLVANNPESQLQEMT